MGIYFRRSRKIAPGARLNVSKSGASFSVGTRGARTTYGKQGITRTYGIPGSGVYHREFTSWDKVERENAARKERRNQENAEMFALFLKSPVKVGLALCCIVFAVLSVVLPGVSAWWFIPLVIVGFTLLCWATPLPAAEQKEEAMNCEAVHAYSFLKKYRSLGTIPDDVIFDLVNRREDYVMVSLDVIEACEAAYEAKHNKDNN